MNKPAIYWDTAKKVTDCLVSVVTPTFKRVELLAKTVASVRQQTHARIEHIVVGDACPLLEDNERMLLAINPTLNIINLDKDTALTYGSARVARVRNAGIALASGDFIAHLDDDNTWDREHVQCLLMAFARRPDAAVAHSYRKLLLDDGTPYAYPYHPWSADIQTAHTVYKSYKRMGIYKEASHLMTDRVTFHEERDCTLDTNELMVRRQIHKRFPFTVNFSDAMKREDLGEDDLFCEMIHKAGYRFVASGEYSLNFRVGGRFTAEVLRFVSHQS